MSDRSVLSHSDRDFFALAGQGAFANPFSAKWRAVDAQLAARGPSAPGSDPVRTGAAVVERVGHLQARHRAVLSQYGARDAALLRTALLYACFLRHLRAFDDLIRLQAAAGDESVAVPFARGVLQELSDHGFTPADAELFFALFYQLRRAYYFIDRNLVGQSACMQGLRSRLWNNVFTHDIALYAEKLRGRMEDFSTLLLGETGSGKGAAAAAIGRSGFIPYDALKRRFAESFARSFIAVNLSQFPEALIEAELFGHRKGAFTGALESHDGVLAHCSAHGAIFLDEVGELGEPIQIKLLQVLQERVYTPVGSHERRRFSGRVIAATNQPVDALRQSGRMRADFYYRLCSDVIEVPPLRERLRQDPAELERLARHVVSRLVEGDGDALLQRVVPALRQSPGIDYAWPGNVRELEQAVRRIVLSGSYSPAAATVPPSGDPLLDGIRDGTLTLHEVDAGYCQRLYKRYGTYEEVARHAAIDRRTARRHIVAAAPPPPSR